MRCSSISRSQRVPSLKSAAPPRAAPSKRLRTAVVGCCWAKSESARSWASKNAASGCSPEGLRACGSAAPRAPMRGSRLLPLKSPAASSACRWVSASSRSALTSSRAALPDANLQISSSSAVRSDPSPPPQSPTSIRAFGRTTWKAGLWARRLRRSISGTPSAFRHSPSRPSVPLPVIKKGSRRPGKAAAARSSAHSEPYCSDQAGQGAAEDHGIPAPHAKGFARSDGRQAAH